MGFLKKSPHFANLSFFFVAFLPSKVNTGAAKALFIVRQTLKKARSGQPICVFKLKTCSQKIPDVNMPATLEIAFFIFFIPTAGEICATALQAALPTHHCNTHK